MTSSERHDQSGDISWEIKYLYPTELILIIFLLGVFGFGYGNNIKKDTKFSMNKCFTVQPGVLNFFLVKIKKKNMRTPLISHKYQSII